MPHTHAELLARHRAILDELTGQPSRDARDRLKGQIIALFGDADAAALEALALKASVKDLVERWKALDRSPSVSVASGRVDHLGASTFIEKGWSKLSLGDPAGAEMALRHALELAPGSDDAEALLGWAQMNQAQYGEARTTCERVLSRAPEHAIARTNMGFICLQEGQHGDAIEHLSQVIRHDADRKATMYAHLYLGMVYGERARYGDAETCFRKALELGPNLVQGWYELGRAYWCADRRTDALAAWRSGAEAGKFSPWGRRCAELLGQHERGGAALRTG